MSDERSKPWYVNERAELLAKLFLEDLKPQAIARADVLAGIDYLAVFWGDDGGFRIAAVEVKAVQRPIREKYVFLTRKTTAEALKRANVPVLFLVVDSKNSRIYFGWAADISMARAPENGSRNVRCVLPVKDASGSRDEILSKIVSA